MRVASLVIISNCLLCSSDIATPQCLSYHFYTRDKKRLRIFIERCNHGLGELGLVRIRIGLWSWKQAGLVHHLNMCYTVTSIALLDGVTNQWDVQGRIVPKIRNGLVWKELIRNELQSMVLCVSNAIRRNICLE